MIIIDAVKIRYPFDAFFDSAVQTQINEITVVSTLLSSFHSWDSLLELSLKYKVIRAQCCKKYLAVEIVTISVLFLQRQNSRLVVVATGIQKDLKAVTLKIDRIAIVVKNYQMVDHKVCRKRLHGVIDDHVHAFGVGVLFEGPIFKDQALQVLGPTILKNCFCSKYWICKSPTNWHVLWGALSICTWHIAIFV